MFDRFCAGRNLDPWAVDIGPILTFEVCRSIKRWSFSSVKVRVSAISFFSGKIEGSTFFTHKLMTLYLNGAKKLSTGRVARAETWDASLVLRALEKAPFKPMAGADMCYVSAELAVLLALTTASGGVSSLH